jgi:hypothetical protein
MAPITFGAVIGSNVSCAPIGTLSIGPFTIDTTGAMVGYNTGTLTTPGCAPYNLSGSGGFSSNQFGASLNGTSPRAPTAGCGGFNLLATLTH